MMIGMTTSGLPLTDGVSFAWVVGLALKATALLAFTGMLTLALARSSAALRHLLWALAIVGVLVLPAIPVAVPWSWHVLPGPSTALDAPTAVFTTLRGAEGAARPESALSPSPVRMMTGVDREGGAEAAPLAGVGESLPAAASAPSREATASLAVLLGTLALFAWATGALLLLSYQLLGRLTLGRMTRDAEPLDDPWLRWELAWAAGASGVARPVRVLLSDRAKVPMTWGVRNPVVLLPESSRDWSTQRLRLVLHHELAHVGRLDALTDTLARVACALHWFNPTMWWATARLRSESEQAADDTVLRGGARASDYAGHLLELVTQLRRAPAGALPLAQRSHFEGRVLAILDPSRKRSGVGRLGAVFTGAVLVAAVVVLGSVAPAQAAVRDSDAGPELAGVPVTSAVTGLTAQPRPLESTAGIEPSDPEPGGTPIPDARPDRAGMDVAAPTGDAFVEDRGEPEPAVVPVTVEVRDTTSVRALTQALRVDTNPEVRRTAAWALGQLEDRAATPALIQALGSDTSVEVRRMVVWAMGQIEDGTAAAALGDALADGDEEVRETALWALGQIEAPEAVGPLSEALSDPEPHVRKTAAWALGQIESEEAVGPLAAALDDEDPEVRSQVVWALGQIESREAVEPLSRALDDQAVQVRRQAAWALGQIESASAVPALARALRQDADSDVRRQCAWALGQIESEDAVPTLAAALRDDDAEVARMAAWALGQIEPRTAPEELVDAARTGTGKLRMTALWALVQIEDPAAVPVLVDALQDEDLDVRTAALRGLARIGSDVAIEAIAELLRDPDPEVRAAAARALARDGGGWSNWSNPNPNPNPNPDPRPRPNGG